MINYFVRRLVPDEKSSDSDVRSRCGVVSGAVGLGLNVVLCAAKFAVGFMLNSISVMADALNNLTDAASSVVALIAFRLANQEPNLEHPFGHGRMEYLSGLFVAVVTLLVGLELAKSSVGEIIHPTATEFSLVSTAILLPAIGVKLWMFAFNHALSKRLNSVALEASARDALSDSVATLAVFLGLLVGKLTGLHADGWLGLAVSVLIILSGLSSVKETIDPLLGQMPDPALVRSIEDIVLAHRELLGLHDLVIHDYGPGRRMASLHAELDASGDMNLAHDVIDMIEREVRKKLNVELVIHMDPIAKDDETTNFLRRLVAEKVKTIDPGITIHDFRITPGPCLTNLIFDMVAPYSCKLSEDELKRSISDIMKKVDERYYTVVKIDRPYV